MTRRNWTRIKQERYDDYYETIDVSKAKVLFELYFELMGDKVQRRIYADNTSEFFLVESSGLYLDFGTYSTNHLGYGLSSEPRYLILTSNDTARSIILNVGYSGIYKADTNLLSFIFSCDAGDIISIEYYNNNRNQISYYERKYDANGRPTKTPASDSCYGKINVTASKNLIRQWQTNMFLGYCIRKINQ